MVECRKDERQIGFIDACAPAIPASFVRLCSAYFLRRSVRWWPFLLPLCRIFHSSLCFSSFVHYITINTLNTMSAQAQANKKQRLLVSTSSASTSTGDAPSTNDNKHDIELLSAWFCPYAQRAWIALNEKLGVGNFQITEAMKTMEPDDHYEKIPLLLECNPNGLVPVIIDRRRRQQQGGETKSADDDGTNPDVIYESLICVEFADEALRGEGPTLLPGNAAQRAHARMWADKLNKKVCTQFYQLLMKQTKEEQDEAAQIILEGLKDFSANCRGPYFYGEDFTLVDIALAPWAVGIRMDVLKHYRQFEVPQTEEYDQYHKWTKAVSERAQFKATASTDLPAMIRVYRRYAEGTALSKVGDAVRGGTALP